MFNNEKANNEEGSFSLKKKSAVIFYAKYSLTAVMCWSWLVPTPERRLEPAGRR